MISGDTGTTSRGDLIEDAAVEVHPLALAVVVTSILDAAAGAR